MLIDKITKGMCFINSISNLCSVINKILFLNYAFVGHCFEQSSGNPPRGLQFVLGTKTSPNVVDTIVMANLVCI